MELDDFRRQWQQTPSPATPVATTATELQVLLQQTSTSPLAQLKQAVRRDARLLWWVSILNVGNVFVATRHHSQWAEMRSVLLAVVGGMILYMVWDTWQRHRIIKGLEAGADTAVSQLRMMIGKLRQLMRLYTWAGVVFGVSFVLCFGYPKRSLLSWPPFTQPLDPTRTVLAVLCMLALGLLMAVGYERQQRLYGRHLDQLEAALRELEAPE